MCKKMLRLLRNSLDTQAKRLIKNSSWVFGANAVRTLLGFLKAILITRGLGVEQYGDYVILVAFVETIREFFNLNFFTPIVKFGAEYTSQDRPDKTLALIKVMCVITAVPCGMFLLVTWMLSNAYHEPLNLTPTCMKFVIPYAVASSLHLFHAMAIAGLRLYYRFRTNSIVQIGCDVFEFICIAATVIVFPHRLDCFLVAVVLSKTVGSVAIIIATYRELTPELSRGSPANMGLVREDRVRISRFVLSNSASRTVQTLIGSGDVLLVGILANSYQAGLYSIAKKLAFSLLRLTDPLKHSIFPQLAQLATESRYGEIKSLLKRTVLAMAAPCGLYLVLGFLVRESLVVTLYGGEFRGAAWPFVVQQTIAALGAVSFWSLPLIQSLGFMGYRFLLLILAMVISFIVALPMTIHFGALGGSFASLVAFSILDLGTIAIVLTALRNVPTGISN
jgi:O-antigen/teichoic acid export membrane protein